MIITSIEQIPVCPITQERMLDPVSIMPCKHKVSALALQGWAQTQELQQLNPLCPLCRSKIIEIVIEDDLQTKIHAVANQHKELFAEKTAIEFLLDQCQGTEEQIRTSLTNAEEKARKKLQEIEETALAEPLAFPQRTFMELFTRLFLIIAGFNAVSVQVNRNRLFEL